jgi:ankyrin repeat protein
MSSPLKYQTFHSRLSSFIDQFNYFPPKYTDPGICCGVSMMATQAFFSSNWDGFIKKLIYLSQEDPATLNEKIAAARIEIKAGVPYENLSKQEQLVLDIAAFFDGIAIFQSPKELIHDTFSLFQDSLIAQMSTLNHNVGLALQSDHIQKKGGLFKDNLFFRCFTKQDAVDFFSICQRILEKDPMNVVFNLTDVSSVGSHASILSYHKEKKAWQFFNINNKDYLNGDLRYSSDPVQLATWLLSLSSKSHVAFACSIIGQGNESDKVKELRDQLKAQATISLPKDKINYLHTIANNNLEFRIVDANDVEFLKALIAQGFPINKNLLFSYAVKLDQTELIEYCLMNHLNIPAEVITTTAARGDITLMRKLLDSGGQIGLDANGNHPLIQAALNGQRSMMALLINEYAVPITVRDSQQRNILWAALISNQHNLVEELIDYKEFSLQEKLADQDTILSFATAICGYQTVDLLLTNGATVELGDLKRAVWEGKLDVLKRFTTEIPLLDITQSHECFNDTTLLHHASAAAKDDIIAWLLDEHKMDVNATSEKRPVTPLTAAICNAGTKTTIELLSQHGATLNAVYIQENYTLLHLAAEFNRIDLIPWLLERSPDTIHQQTTSGMSAFDIAVSNGHTHLSIMLLKTGVQLEKKHIDAAMHAGHFELAFVLSETTAGKKEKEKETLFLSVFKSTLPHMNNTQIVECFDRITNTFFTPFTFIHHQHHDFFDRLRLGIFRREYRLTAPPWQTAPFLKVAYALSEQFIQNLNNGEKIDPGWENNPKLNAFIQADFGNFFTSKSTRRKKDLLFSIQKKLSQNQDDIPLQSTNIHVKNIYSQIGILKNYGVYLSNQSSDKGHQIIVLSDCLKEMMDLFNTTSQEQPYNEKNLFKLKNDFKILLNSKNDVMKKHRSIWKPIVANILISLTGIGLLAIIFHAAISAAILRKNNKEYSLNNALFFGKTASENKIEDIEKAIESLSMVGKNKKI